METRLSGQTLGNRGDKTFQVRHWEMGKTRLSGQTLGMGGEKTFPIKHCELGETRPSGQTLGELLWSDTWGRQSFQVRHWDNFSGLTVGDWEDRTFLVRHWENFSGLTLGNVGGWRQDLSDQTLRTGGDEAFRSDTGRASLVRHLGETRLSGQTLREGWRQNFQVRH